jgi:hypothetical protein
MKIFSIMPHYADSDFNAKKMLLSSISRKYNSEIMIGTNSGLEDDVNISLEMLRNADAVLADLTLERPSCYFEVGFAQSMKKPVFLIAQTGTEIHQVASRSLLKTYSNLTEYSSLVEKVVSSLFR